MGLDLLECEFMSFAKTNGSWLLPTIKYDLKKLLLGNFMLLVITTEEHLNFNQNICKSANTKLNAGCGLSSLFSY